MSCEGFSQTYLTVRCSYDGLTRSLSNRVYMTVYAAYMYFFQLIVIVTCYFFIVSSVIKHENGMRQQAKKMNVTSLRIGQDSNNMAAEIRVAKVAIFNVTLWLISWTPYLVFVIMGLWGDQTQITPLPAMIQVLLPKTSCAYNPIIYCLSHPKFRVVSFLTWYFIPVPSCWYSNPTPKTYWGFLNFWCTPRH